MKTLKEIQIERIIKNCDNVLIVLLEQLQYLMDDAIACNIQPNKARKIYKKYMQRASFYNHISFIICEKYKVERKQDIADFSKFINFFEC